MTDETKQKISLAKKGCEAWNKGIPLSATHCSNLSAALKGRASWSKGKRFSKEYVLKLSISHMGKSSGMKGKKHSPEARFKIRTAILDNLSKQGISHKSNPIACKFIDELNKSNGWNLQHAGNGGEVQVYGYLLDGFDSKRGIVFEYDEPRHHLKKKKEKDRIRQNDIFQHFASANKSIEFWRYDERYEKLYRVTPEVL